MKKIKGLKGQICFSSDRKTIIVMENAYLLYRDNEILGVFKTIPPEYAGAQIRDCGNHVIIPGLADLHTHAPQYGYRGLGMDLELLDWLNQRAFPEEARFSVREYAENAYRIFARDMKNSATTRLCIFATRHADATVCLMDMMEETGLKSMVGKVNMDRNAPDYLRESSVLSAVNETKDWLDRSVGKYRNVQPVLTPRFTPSCTDDLMEQIGKLREQYDLPVQSHLSENRDEIAWVKKLCPWSKFYGETYDRYGLFGKKKANTVMAHCVYSGEEEQKLMKKNGVFIAHCPESNTNIASGIAPIRKYLEDGQKIGLGSDMAGGSAESIFRAMVLAIQVSKLRYCLVDKSLKPLTFEEAFYMGSMGGGEFFGKVGTFQSGYELDALVINDNALHGPYGYTLRERLERIVYLSERCTIAAKYAAGKEIIIK